MIDAKLCGLVLIVGASAWTGFGAAAGVRQSVRQLQELKRSLELMRCEISCHLTPICTLSGTLATSCRGELSRFYRTLQLQLEEGQNVSQAAQAAMRQCRGLRLPVQVVQGLNALFDSFGGYDSAGQLGLIELTQKQVEAAMTQLEAEKNSRCRCYEVLGICTGLALAILVA